MFIQTNRTLSHKDVYMKQRDKRELTLLDAYNHQSVLDKLKIKENTSMIIKHVSSNVDFCNERCHDY